MNILLIGGNGFIGKSLINYISENSNHKVFVLDRNHNTQISDSCQFTGTLDDINFISSVFKRTNPDIIYFLITKFYITSDEDLKNAKKNSTDNIHNIFQHIKKKSKIVYVSSSAVYGDVPLKYQPLEESIELNPISRYGKLKAFEEDVFTKLSFKLKANLIITRIFNITGPREPSRMVGGSFVSQLVSNDELQVGNLYPKRDFLDVRDVSRALQTIGVKGKIGDCYNICSGTSISIKDYLDLVINQLNSNPKIIEDTNRLNPNEIDDLVGDNSKLASLGWDIIYPLKQSIKDLIKSHKDSVA